MDLKVEPKTYQVYKFLLGIIDEVTIYMINVTPVKYREINTVR